jgi:UDP-3-O-[3-hydroxymyristoyl] glucosamine N-acyltransferase
MVFEFASVGSHAVIGPLAIIKAYSRVAYGAQLGENTVLAPYAYVGSYSKIGPGTVVLARGTVQRRTNLGKGCIVHAHAYVNADMPDGAVARGVPAVISR